MASLLGGRIMFEQTREIIAKSNADQWTNLPSLPW